MSPEAGHTQVLTALKSALDGREQAAFLGYLLDHPIDHSMIRMPEDTAAKQQMRVVATLSTTRLRRMAATGGRRQVDVTERR